MNDSMVTCILTHFLDTVEDNEIKQVIEKALCIATNHLRELEKIYEQEGIVKPTAFPVKDHVIPHAPRLFSDLFYLEYIRHMVRFGLTSHTSSISISIRNDLHELFTNFLDHATELDRFVKEVMLSKGVYTRTPYMHYPSKVDFVEKQTFLTGWFGKRRMLLSVEATHLITNCISNELGKVTLLGFSQVMKDVEIRNYFIRGIRMTKTIVNSIHDVLQESDIPTTMLWDTSITDSTTAPFSEQLMTSIVNSLSAIGIATYGSSMSMCFRHDLVAFYSSYIVKAGAYGEDGLNLMIERGWLEQPPTFLNHIQIATSQQSKH
jgi:hypothetical protein